MPTMTRIRKSPSSNAAYKLKIIDENQLEEVFSIELSRWKIYMFFSSIFVFMAALTALIIIFTPVKYYIPGYGNRKAQQQTVELKKQLDSISAVVKEQELYAANIRAVINGSYNGAKDTTLLDLDKVHTEDMNSIMPDAEAIKKDAAASLKKENRSKAAHGN